MIKMSVGVSEKYKRRGKTCRFTFKLKWESPLKDAEGEEYTESWHWAYLTWDGVDWHEGPPPDPRMKSRNSHDSYPPPREPGMDELRLALDRQPVECRALKAMGACK